MSIAAFADELDRAHTLGLLGVVLHPGTCTAGSEDDALRLVADAIRTAFALRPRRKTMVLLEHTAGQGRVLGWRFDRSRRSSRTSTAVRAPASVSIPAT